MGEEKRRRKGKRRGSYWRKGKGCLGCGREWGGGLTIKGLSVVDEHWLTVFFCTGLAGGIVVSTFSKTLAILIGSAVVGIQVGAPPWCLEKEKVLGERDIYGQFADGGIVAGGTRGTRFTKKDDTEILLRDRRAVYAGG